MVNRSLNIRLHVPTQFGTPVCGRPGECWCNELMSSEIARSIALGQLWFGTAYEYDTAATTTTTRKEMGKGVWGRG